MPLPYPVIVFTPLTTITAQDHNNQMANVTSLANGTGMNDGIIGPRHLTVGVRGLASGEIVTGSAGAQTIECGFRPRTIEFMFLEGNVGDNDSPQQYDRRSHGHAIWENDSSGAPTRQYVHASGAGTVNMGRSRRDSAILMASTSDRSILSRAVVTGRSDTGFTINVISTSNHNYAWIARP